MSFYYCQKSKPYSQITLMTSQHIHFKSDHGETYVINLKNRSTRSSSWTRKKTGNMGQNNKVEKVIQSIRSIEGKVKYYLFLMFINHPKLSWTVWGLNIYLFTFTYWLNKILPYLLHLVTECIRNLDAT